jgi:hypothetical protein
MKASPSHCSKLSQASLSTTKMTRSTRASLTLNDSSTSASQIMTMAGKGIRRTSSSGELKVKQRTKLKIQTGLGRNTFKPGKHVSGSKLRRSSLYPDSEMISWMKRGVTNDVWDLKDRSNNIDGRTNASSSSNTYTKSKATLRSLSPHVLDLLAREDFASIMAFQTKDVSANHPPFVEPPADRDATCSPKPMQL